MKKLILFLFLCSPWLVAHDIQYSAAQGKAYVIQVGYAGGGKFNYESFEIYSPTDRNTAFMVGRTDAEGRIVFVPNTNGKWLIKTFSADGHGANIELNVDRSLAQPEKKLNFFEKYSKQAFGLGIIMFIFSLITIFGRKKK